MSCNIDRTEIPTDAVSKAAFTAAAEIGPMRERGEQICDVTHIVAAMRQATLERQQQVQ